MLRPERMSKISVTGSKAVLDDVIGALYGLSLVHVTDYDGSWEGFEPGDPLDGAEEASDDLVTVRSIESILDLDRETVGPATDVDQAAREAEIEEIRTRVNDLDDRRDEIESDLEAVQEELERTDAFVDLGIDLDLLGGYDAVQVRVGEADEAAVRAALDADERIEAYETWATEDVVAAFAYPADSDDETALEDALVGVEFATLEVPDASGEPNDHVEQLVHRRQQLASRLEGVENEIESVKLDAGSFLVAAEEALTREVQKREVPLEFATTNRSFVAEGWVPTDRYPDLESALADSVGDHVAVEELERAAYGESHREHVPEPESTAGGEGEGVAADGGVANGDQPPVVQDNPGPMKPFELLVEVINRPKYGELDPTVVLFLTFPLFFGFMIGDFGYGILYVGLGYWLTKNFDSDALKSLGGVAMWAGGFTMLFGILYGEFFGLHQLGTLLFGAGGPPLHKGLQPHYVYYAQAWLLASVVVGVAHLVLGWTFQFVEDYQNHGLADAVLESGSWIMLTVGLWVWVFSVIAEEPKPDFMYTVFASGEGAAIPLGFTGFSPTVGWAGLAVSAVGLIMVLKAEGFGIGLIESITQGFAHVISYTRMAAVLLAKAGMALAVNLLVFGATLHDGEFHYIFFSGPDPANEVFPGLINGDGLMLVIGAIVGAILLVVGHLLVLALGVTSAGLQAVRLEYVEFFGKFYEGGGVKYNPFGYESSYTKEE